MRSVSSKIARPSSPYGSRREKAKGEIRVRFCVYEEVLLSWENYEPFLKVFPLFYLSPVNSETNFFISHQ